MIVYPAIDLSKGEIVRLQRGNFARKTVYSKDVRNQINQFEKNGADSGQKE